MNPHDSDHYNCLCKLGDALTMNKVWGEELIICRTPHAAKIMIFKPGFQVSTHWHQYKSETFILISGALIVETLDAQANKHTVTLNKPFSSITLMPMTPHTFYCPQEQTENTVFIEASTYDSDDDNYRLTKSGPRPYEAFKPGT